MIRLPTQLKEWATKHGIPPVALLELMQVVGALVPAAKQPRDPNRTSEAYVQSLVRLEAPQFDVFLTRNNVGALKDATGRPVRYGLANETAEQNKVLKSHDLIGWRKRLIEQWMVGSYIAQFVSRECKEADWVWSGNAHEQAQLNWALLVMAAGGDAAFVTGEGSFN